MTTVETSSGLVRGVDAGVHSFRGVPYAAPPVGPARFAPPRPHEPWSGVRDATRPGPTAAQPVLPVSVFGQTIVAGDDVLHLDIHTPSVTGPLRPVVVWIHGGGMVVGGNADVYGAGLARRGIVVVAINYRLGVDGFLVLDDAPPNRGVLDWVAALGWVRENIARFGGDPGNVTVAGQSAGAAAAIILLAVPGAAGLFHRVFAMSGTPWNVVDVATARLHAVDLARRVGAEPTVAGIGAVERDRLLAVQQEVAPVAGLDGFDDPLALVRRLAGYQLWLGPVVDGDVVPEHPLVAVARGVGGEVPVVTGSTAEEADALLSFIGAAVNPADADAILADLGLAPSEVGAWREELARRAQRAGRPPPTPAAELGAAVTALSFRIPALQLADARATAGPAPTFVYEVTWHADTPLGTVHGLDVPLVWDALGVDGAAILLGDPPPLTLAGDMAGALVGFATGGAPGWPAYDQADRTEMAFDVPSHARHDPDPAARALFGPLRGIPSVAPAPTAAPGGTG
jgi:para-nitrobenzyl esterase